MTAFFIGDLALDEYYTAEQWPGVADKGFITELPQECGGSIANAAVVHAALGGETEFISLLNDSPLSERLIGDLHANGVSTHLEPHVPQGFWDEVLEGTLLKDFWEGCILSVVNFLKAQLTPFPDTTLPLSDAHKRVISLLNLIWQVVNSASGPYIFVSKPLAVEAAGSPLSAGLSCAVCGCVRRG